MSGLNTEVCFAIGRIKALFIDDTGYELDLSYRLLRNPFSYDDGNIAKVAEKALHETFEPYKAAFAKKNLDLHLLIVRE